MSDSSHPLRVLVIGLFLCRSAAPSHASSKCGDLDSNGSVVEVEVADDIGPA